MPQPGHSRLEPSIVVSCHLWVLHFLSVIFEAVIAIRSTYQCTVQHMRIRTRIVVVPPVAVRWGWWAAAGSVVWSLRCVLPKTDHIAAPAVSKRVVNLLPCKLAVGGRIEAKVSGSVGGKAIGSPGIAECKTFWSTLDWTTCNLKNGFTT